MTTGEGLRVCAGCGGEIPPTRSSRSKFCSDRCKERTRSRRRYSENPEYQKKVREKSLRWQRNHPQQAKENKLKWARENPEQVRSNKRKYYQIKNYGREVTIPEMTKDRYRAARALGYRSGLEVAVARYLEENKIPFEYESLKLQYVIPEKTKTYTPDIILPNGIILELKGEFKPADRTKMKAVKAAHPDLDIRFVFSDANKKITNASKTTCADWAEKNGFPFAHKLPPTEWFNECKDSRSVD